MCFFQIPDFFIYLFFFCYHFGFFNFLFSSPNTTQVHVYREKAENHSFQFFAVGSMCVMRGSGFLVGAFYLFTFLYLTLKTEEVRNAIPISFFFFFQWWGT